jgi:mRNA interferase HigB
MRVKIIKKQTVYDYVQKHPASRPGFNNWIMLLNAAGWNTPNDIFNTFRSADILGKGTNRIVFDIGGNNYRVICSYHFGAKTVQLFVAWIGTHAEYTKLCNRKEQYHAQEY